MNQPTTDHQPAITEEQQHQAPSTKHQKSDTRANARFLVLGAWLSSCHRVILSIALVGLILRLAFALLPLAVHLVVLEDDAWMVTAIARNWALGHGITADGVHATTGFQPLYPLTLGALPYLVAPNALDAGFTANLVICALLNTLAIWPLWWLARRFGGERAGLLAVALFALNPLLIRVSVNAMETSLGLLLLLELFVAFYYLNLAKTRNVLLLALLTALAVLARVDAALAFAAIALTMFIRPPTTDQRPQSNTNQQGFFRVVVGRPWSVVGVYVAVTMLLLAPYFLLNKFVGGSFGPASGTALAYMHSFKNAFYLTNGFTALYNNTAVYLGWLSGQPRYVALLLVVFVGALLWLLGRRLLAAAPLLLYLPVPPLYYGYMLQQSRERYFVGLSAVLIILLAWLGAEIMQRWPGRASMLAVGGAALALIALNSGAAWSLFQRVSDEDQQTQPTAYIAALWVRDNLPADALIGAKNSGIYQYYSNHTIINIDGKLNHEIVPVLEQRALLDYLRRTNVTYLVDREETMVRHITFYSQQFGPAPHHVAPILTQRIAIYGKIAANALGANLPLNLDAPPESFVPTRPFSDAAEIIERFERPNDRNNPLVVYRLKPVGVGAP